MPTCGVCGVSTTNTLATYCKTTVTEVRTEDKKALVVLGHGVSQSSLSSVFDHLDYCVVVNVCYRSIFKCRDQQLYD